MGNSVKTEKVYAGVDILKLFFAVCIVALHSNAFEFLPQQIFFVLEKTVFRLAVPFFFVASGFFMGNKLNKIDVNEYGGAVRNYCKRLLKPYIVFSAVNIALNAAYLFLKGNSIGKIVFKIVQSILFYPYGALWYVYASIVGMLLLLPFLKRKRLDLAIASGLVLYVFALLCNNYYFVIKGTVVQRFIDTYLNVCVSARNGIFTGFLSLGLGILCSKIFGGKRFEAGKAGFVFVVFFALYLAEIIFVASFGKPADDGALYITHLLFVPALLYVSLSRKIVLDKKLSETFRNLSTGIYFLHRPVLWFVGILNLPAFLNFIMAMIIAVSVCLIAYKTKKEPFYGLLK